VTNFPNFFVGDIPVFGDLILAPMDGISERPFRSLVRRLGSAMSYTEFINAIDILIGYSRYQKKVEFAEFERPVVFQIFDDDPERCLDAALRLLPHRADIIDLNLGCSARCVTNRGAGAALLKNPSKIAHIVTLLVNNLPVPVTVKIRLGWDEQTRNFLEIARIVEECGVKLIAVHGRTKSQNYNHPADWDAIAQIKANAKIPVLANGDVRTVADIRAIKKHTNCDGIMIGRAALQNPWIFCKKDRHEVTDSEVYAWIQDHLMAMTAFHGTERGLVLFRKYLKRLLQPMNISEALMIRLLTTPTIDLCKHALEHVFSIATSKDS
jgi:nifR3 family TIM-barrel protein